MRAAALLRHRFPECYYAIVGKPSPGNDAEEVRLRALIAEHELDNVVHFLGEMEDTASVFAALDVAVVPSVQTEPFGCVVSEAMAAGTAVVGSRAGGIAEQIVAGESGLLFAPGDAEDLALQLGRLLGDSAFRQLLAAQGEEHVRTHFLLQTTILNMAALFERLAGDTARSGGAPVPAENVQALKSEMPTGSAPKAGSAYE